jgi:hypothetical protein
LFGRSHLASCRPHTRLHCWRTQMMTRGIDQAASAWQDDHERQVDAGQGELESLDEMKVKSGGKAVRWPRWSVWDSTCLDGEAARALTLFQYYNSGAALQLRLITLAPCR